MVCAAGGEPACAAVVLAEMADSCTFSALASPSLRNATATSIASPRWTREGVAITDAMVRLAGLWTVADQAGPPGGASGGADSRRDRAREQGREGLPPPPP